MVLVVRATGGSTTRNIAAAHLIATAQQRTGSVGRLVVTLWQIARRAPLSSSIGKEGISPAAAAAELLSAARPQERDRKEASRIEQGEQELAEETASAAEISPAAAAQAAVPSVVEAEDSTEQALAPAVLAAPRVCAAVVACAAAAEGDAGRNGETRRAQS